MRHEKPNSTTDPPSAARKGKRYGPDDVIYAQVTAWDPVKNYALVPHPSNPYRTLIIMRDFLSPQPMKGKSPIEIERQWIKFRFGDIDFSAGQRRGILSYAEFVEGPAKPANGRGPNIAHAFSHKKKEKSEARKAQHQPIAGH